MRKSNLYKVRQLTDKKEILTFLERDAGYAAYAIGDLEPALFAQSEWTGAQAEGQIHALTLHFKGLDPPALFVMGEPAALVSILERDAAPNHVYLTCRERHLATVQACYRTTPPTPMWRMSLNPASFRYRPVPDVAVQSLQHPAALQGLYLQGGGETFNAAQLETGVFYGVYERERLVAAAGTHLLSPSYSRAAVGNIYTAPDYRGRGYGTAVTGAVVSTLLRRGIRHIFLNVAQTNRNAIHIYEKLGFTRHCPFLEMSAVR